MVVHQFSKDYSRCVISWGLLFMFASALQAEGVDTVTAVVATDFGQQRLSPKELADFIRQQMDPDDFLQLTQTLLPEQTRSEEFAHSLDSLPTAYQHESLDTGGKDPDMGSSAQEGFDQAVVRRGEGLFQSYCTICHDAERATSKRKSYAAWLTTVHRMAAKDDADIPSSAHVPIATYLASLNAASKRSSSNEEASLKDSPFHSTVPFHPYGAELTRVSRTQDFLSMLG